MLLLLGWLRASGQFRDARSPAKSTFDFSCAAIGQFSYQLQIFVYKTQNDGVGMILGIIGVHVLSRVVGLIYHRMLLLYNRLCWKLQREREREAEKPPDVSLNSQFLLNT